MVAPVAEVVDEVTTVRKAMLEAMATIGDLPEPVTLVRMMVDRGFSEDLARAVLWYLMDAKELVLTSDWVLKRRNDIAHTNGIALNNGH